MEFLRSYAGQSLIERARTRPKGPVLYDLQLRSGRPKSKNSWASLYYGLTTVLNIHESKGKFRLKVADTHKDATPHWNEAWGAARSLEAVLDGWSQVERYLDAVTDTVSDRHIGKEGQVHAALCCGESDAFRVINREASPTFLNKTVKDAVRKQIYGPLNAAVDADGASEPWWPRGFRTPASPDVLATDVGGRLTVIEAKHHSATDMIAEVAIQASYYARVMAWLLATDHLALDRIEIMLRQRAELGLTLPGVLHLLRPARVVPVVAIGPKEPSAEARERFWRVAEVVDAAPSAQAIEPLELWYVNEFGRIVEIERAADLGR